VADPDAIPAAVDRSVVPANLRPDSTKRTGRQSWERFVAVIAALTSLIPALTLAQAGRDRQLSALQPAVAVAALSAGSRAGRDRVAVEPAAGLMVA
jgi:hypothetical protein